MVVGCRASGADVDGNGAAVLVIIFVCLMVVCFVTGSVPTLSAGAVDVGEEMSPPRILFASFVSQHPTLTTSAYSQGMATQLIPFEHSPRIYFPSEEHCA